jgi:hypothetical protein
MSQYEVVNENRRFVFGWDQPLSSFFLQVHHEDALEDENPIVWLGATQETAMYEVDDLVGATCKHGLKIGTEMLVTLFRDKDEER